MIYYKMEHYSISGFAPNNKRKSVITDTRRVHSVTTGNATIILNIWSYFSSSSKVKTEIEES